MTDATAPRGQLVVIVALAMIALLLAVGLVIDTGVGFMSRRDAQNIADLSAMAGTKVVADHYVDGGRTGAQVYAAVDGAAQANGCSGDCSWTATYVAAPPSARDTEPSVGSVSNGGVIPSGALGVRVSVERAPSAFFMRIVGRTSIDVAAAATALTADQSTVPPGVLLPIAMSPPDSMIPGAIYDITNGSTGPGNFGWLTWDGANDAVTLVTSICTPDNPELTVPLLIEGGPGTMNKSAGRACLDEYIANGTTVLIPIWDGADPGHGSHSEYNIIGFAAFKLTARSQPAVDNIQGAFQEFYPLSTVPAGFGVPPPSADDITYFLGLVR